MATRKKIAQISSVITHTSIHPENIHPFSSKVHPNKKFQHHFRVAKSPLKTDKEELPFQSTNILSINSVLIKPKALKQNSENKLSSKPNLVHPDETADSDGVRKRRIIAGFCVLTAMLIIAMILGITLGTLLNNTSAATTTTTTSTATTTSTSTSTSATSTTTSTSTSTSATSTTTSTNTSTSTTSTTDTTSATGTASMTTIASIVNINIPIYNYNE
ncbi:unnamed protein product [Rotaria socialis]|uniref:Uncharacterized protein n=1 Tax=Rotaria socialis TaxID=392032 RepID=A0A821IXA0_9BILA|nr:unnamed protein product [Rotaria socialis]